MDDYVISMLQGWHLEDLIGRFRDEFVDREAFMLLTPDIIRELIPRLGRRAIFVSRYNAFKKSIADPDAHQEAAVQPTAMGATEPQKSPAQYEPPTPNIKPDPDEPCAGPSTPLLPGQPITITRHDKEKGIESFIVQEIQQEGSEGDESDDSDVIEIPQETCVYEVEIDDEPFPKQIKLEVDVSQQGQPQNSTPQYKAVGVTPDKGGSSAPPTNDKTEADKLRILLQKSPLTRELIGLPQLDKYQRMQLCNALVHYLIVSSPTGKVSCSTFRVWAKAIEEVFPCEKMGHYYRPGHMEGSNGKLQERYYYVSKTRKTELNQLRTQQRLETTEDAEATSSAADDYIQCDDVNCGVSRDSCELEALLQLKRIVSTCFMLKGCLNSKTLTPNQRKTLAANIVCYLMDKNGGPISFEEMDCYARAIEKLFPQENASIFFRRGVNRSRVYGKLYDRYGYMKRKKSFANGKTYNEFLDEKTPIGQMQTMKTVEEARDLWTKTHKHRKEYTRKFLPSKMFEMFPFLTQPDGYELLLEDFNREFPDNVDTFKTNWPEYAANIFRFVQENDFLDSVTEFSTQDWQDDIMTSGFILLPLFFKLSKRSERNWSPTRLEVAHNFVIYGQEFKNVVDFLRQRQETFERYKFRPVPVVVAIGPTISSIDSSYVVINQVFFKFDTLQEAVEACIKIYITFGLRYQEETSIPWLFLQRFVMKLELPWDNLSTRIFAVLEAMNMPLR